MALTSDLPDELARELASMVARFVSYDACAEWLADQEHDCTEQDIEAFTRDPEWAAVIQVDRQRWADDWVDVPLAYAKQRVIALSGIAANPDPRVASAAIRQIREEMEQVYVPVTTGQLYRQIVENLGAADLEAEFDTEELDDRAKVRAS